MPLTQVEVEETMYLAGVEKARAIFQKAEEKGRAGEAPYAQRIYQRYVLPLAELIREETGAKIAGRRAAHAALLKPLDPEAVAFLTVRTCLNHLLKEQTEVRSLGYRIGSTLNAELVLGQIELELPELYHTLSRDFHRRRSKQERHRMTVFKLQAKKAGIEFIEWPAGAPHQVGLWLIDRLGAIGFLDIPTPTTVNKRTSLGAAQLGVEVLAELADVKGFVLESMPAFGPCVEPPLPWHANVGGGFHTPRMRARHRTLVKCARSARPVVDAHEMPVVFAAANALQETAWHVNEAVLKVVREAHELGIELTAEVVNKDDAPKPERAAWMDVVAKEDQTPAQAEELKEWKRAMRKWWEGKALRGTSFGRFYTATRQAITFKAEERLYFVYMADSRGRLYPMTYGLNPQGSDLQKALLEFADGLPVTDPDAERWFLVQGANKWGFDKATLAERAAWVRERADLFLSFADAPLDNLEWRKADKPLQFLAWCFEFAAWRRSPGTFLSRLPVSMDGTCNGLQNFSAMLRDAVGGEATNITANETGRDIYKMVADAAAIRMASSSDPLVRRWLAAGVDRSLVKRSVMTTPYGVTKGSAIKYVVEDSLKSGEYPEFQPDEYRAAAMALMDHVWPAIADVVVKSREAMEWLRKAASAIVAAHKGDDDPMISWVTPSGFLATQAYFEQDEHRISTKLHGECKIRVNVETDLPDKGRHLNGMAPNFVHSMDASHLHLVTERAARLGIKHLAMIHDDYGTHAANAQALFALIREEFLKMYVKHDPLQELADRYPEAGTPPEKGTLDLSQVLRSQFFFS